MANGVVNVVRTWHSISYLQSNVDEGGDPIDQIVKEGNVIGKYIICPGLFGNKFFVWDGQECRYMPL